MSATQAIVIVAAGTAVMLVAILVVFYKCWHSVASGHALIVNRLNGPPRVAFTGALVMPVVQRAEVIDLSVQTIEIARTGKDGVICRDNIRADLKATFFVRVGRTTEDILKVAHSIGCRRATDSRTLEDLFTAKFSEAIKTVAKQLEFEELYTCRHEFVAKICEVIGKELNGYQLDDVAIDWLEQTPLEMLDPNNILDAQGIKKILRQTAELDGLQRQAPRNATTNKPAPLTAELERLGLADVRITTEVTCDVGLGRPELSVRIDDGDGGDDATLAKLPSSVPRAAIAAVGTGELTCSGGRATFRWKAEHVSTDQLIAGARLVHALRDDDHAYR